MVVIQGDVVALPTECNTATSPTNWPSLAWALVLLYKQRWGIEKVFDELKTKLEEQRS